jgi:hypothetical protein
MKNNQNELFMNSLLKSMNSTIFELFLFNLQCGIKYRAQYYVIGFFFWCL